MRAAIRSSSHACRRGTAVVLLVSLGLGLATGPPVAADGGDAPKNPATFRSISAGLRHTCAIVDDGTVKCWGANNNGQLGYGDTNSRGDGPGEMGDSLPNVDLGTGRTAISIAAGGFHTCALLDNANVKCWGASGDGQLGYGDTTTRGDGPGEMGNSLPTVSLGTGRTATAITVGDAHTCAVLDNANIKCWGFNGFGQLGYGDTTTRGWLPGQMGNNLPVVALGTPRTAAAVTTGAAHTCALLDDHTVKCWGNSDFGQLGAGDTNARGDGPGEMGIDLPTVHLGSGRTVVRMGITVSIDANQAEVVAGQQINYFVTVLNTGGRGLTNVRVFAPDVGSCAQNIGALSPGGQVIFGCNHTTSTDDIPIMTNQVLVTTGQGVFALSGTRRTRVLTPTYRPDGRPRLGAGAPIGNNVYNTTGAGQTRTATVPNLGTATFTATIENDGNATDGYTVKGLGTTSRYTVTYKDGPTNVTAQVLAGTYALTNLAPGDTHDLTITIRAKPGTPVGNTISRVVTFTSNTTNTKDAVKPPSAVGDRLT